MNVSKMTLPQMKNEKSKLEEALRQGKGNASIIAKRIDLLTGRIKVYEYMFFGNKS